MVMEIAQQASTEEFNDPKPKRGVLGRLKPRRTSRRSSKKIPEKRTDSPVDTASEEEEPMHFSREGIPIVTSQAGKSFRASDVRPVAREKEGHRGSSMVGYKPPSARESAFSGPPRYDWIDIETAAAVKVQAAYRRNKVMWQLEREGKSTAQMRNRIRKRQVKQRLAVSEDTPSLCQFCGLGLMFGDATEEEEEAVKQLEREHYEAKKKEREQREAQLRTFKMKKKPDLNLNEGVEVVETFDEEDEEREISI